MRALPVSDAAGWSTPRLAEDKLCRLPADL
jgi:hypothetical protein